MRFKRSHPAPDLSAAPTRLLVRELRRRQLEAHPLGLVATLERDLECSRARESEWRALAFAGWRSEHRAMADAATNEQALSAVLAPYADDGLRELTDFLDDER